MDTQCRLTRLETQAVPLQRLTIKVDVQAFRDFDLDPRQTGSHEHVVDAEAIGQQVFQGAYHLLRRWQNADIKQSIVNQRLRAQHTTTTGLSAISDTQCQQLATPVKVRSLQFAIGRMQFTEAR